MTLNSGKTGGGRRKDDVYLTIITSHTVIGRTFGRDHTAFLRSVVYRYLDSMTDQGDD